VVVELEAYVAKRENATTALSWNGKHIEVTPFLLPLLHLVPVCVQLQP
jgi:hypothetical protein